MMIRSMVIFALLWLTVTTATAQEIKVDPTGVNVNSQGATTAFLTYASIKNYRPVEACWCGELIEAAPDIGFKCDPTTLFGCLPARYDHSTQSGSSGFTDIMSIPPSVTRRAYQAAQQGADSRFFYVRRFVSLIGGPDQYVAVTCRLTGGGARAPLSLTDVKLSFNLDKPVLLLKPGERLPEIKAELTYTGTGRLKGRWEIVLPGDEPPAESDLLTEATLPIERRSLQRHYTQLSRFNVLLPPVGSYILAGPEASQLPNKIAGSYLILLRVEASDDREADSDLAVIGAGPATVHSGAVAGFPLPPLRYFVGSGSATEIGTITLLTPVDNEIRAGNKPLDFCWNGVAGAFLYRLELMGADDEVLLSALLQPDTTIYRLPSWLPQTVTKGSLRWRVTALDEKGNSLNQSTWKSLRLIQSK